MVDRRRETKKWNDDLFSCHDPFLVRILQKSQENGQNRTNTDTGKEREYKSWENDIK
ncbi:hypothetical protein Tco_0070404, partial [Tanacetum coccineum]